MTHKVKKHQKEIIKVHLEESKKNNFVTYLKSIKKTYDNMEIEITSDFLFNKKEQEEIYKIFEEVKIKNKTAEIINIEDIKKLQIKEEIIIQPIRNGQIKYLKGNNILLNNINEGGIVKLDGFLFLIKNNFGTIELNSGKIILNKNKFYGSIYFKNKKILLDKDDYKKDYDNIIIEATREHYKIYKI